MPLPPTAERELLHVRNLDLRGYRRADGLYEVEGRVTDVRSHPRHTPGSDLPQPAGIPVHDMCVRLVIDEVWPGERWQDLSISEIQVHCAR